MRVLLVEDDEHAAKRLAEFFGRCPRVDEIGTWGSMRGLRERLRGYAPHLVVVDVQLADGAIYEQPSVLDPAYQRAEIVALSSSDVELKQLQASELGPHVGVLTFNKNAFDWRQDPEDIPFWWGVLNRAHERAIATSPDHLKVYPEVGDEPHRVARHAVVGLESHRNRRHNLFLVAAGGGVTTLPIRTHPTELLDWFEPRSFLLVREQRPKLWVARAHIQEVTHVGRGGLLHLVGGRQLPTGPCRVPKEKLAAVIQALAAPEK